MAIESATSMSSAEIVALNRAHTFFSWSIQGALDPIAIDHAEGVWLYTPDGTKILTKRFEPSGPIQLAIVPADGQGDVIPIGPSVPMAAEGQTVDWAFSPDGSQVLVTYSHDGSTWLLNADGTGDQQMDWSAYDGQSWQRLAP